ncbi:hypothetical protein C8J47_2937 [Sphingomonas sp. PP-F2F-G114-C0414]|uniref:hypothetical protein n=1 Tax=Sphingomonas sp. PP-F2F-G114-C0414 TaxID=2135662 RepID=UPI000F0D964D|nr:hypothetical protein [Sphingomonas sp. PP-F2F-G114-C0414]RMB28707.1 hypothetical protein C8J47_2937 [Sphingomonas sp. PP-F2F-G114-C0414]
MITANAERLKAAQLLLIRFIQIGRSGSKADAKRAAALQRSPAGWPIPNHGGFRIDTKSNAEIARWVFPKSSYSLERLARSISDPRYFLKLCGAAGDLQAALPSGGTLHAPGYFMRQLRCPRANTCRTDTGLRSSEPAWTLANAALARSRHLRIQSVRLQIQM